MQTRSSLSLAVLLGSSLCTLTGQAQDKVTKDPMQGRFTVNLKDPESNLPSAADADKYPLDWGYMLMELDERALAASKSGDWKSAVKFHRAAAKLTPERAISFALLCTDYEKAGQRAEAVDACFKSLNLDGSKLEYFAHYVHLVAERPGGTDPEEVENALKVIAHLKTEKSGELTAFELQCELGLRTRSESALSECSRELLARTPHSPRSISYAWALAVQRQDFKGARKLIRDAKREGATPAALAKMEDATNAAEHGEPSGAAVPSVPPTPPAPPSTPIAASSAPVVPSSAPAVSASTDTVVSSSYSMHPMFRWLLGLLVALAVSIPAARRFASPRRGA